MNTLSASQKKIAKIAAVILGIILTAIMAVTAVVLTTDTGRNVVDTVAEPFRPVTLPESSLELTRVSEAPVNKPDETTDEHINVDMEGREIVQPTLEPDNPDVPHHFPSAEEMNQVSNIGVRFQVPSVGLDVPYGMIDEVDGVIRPTNFTSAFGVRNRGVPYNETDRGTAYVALHALDDDGNGNLSGLAPGNWLIDGVSRQPRLANGEIIKIGNDEFRVESNERLGKGLISRNKEIWDDSITDRIVLITCFPSSADNQIFVAYKV